MTHWIMTVEGRRHGWLDGETHFRVREIMLHTVMVYEILIPTYCLMPDHVHCLILGLKPQSDQLSAIRFMRRHINDVLRLSIQGRLQKQAYDNVLRECDRERGAFQAMACYILDNPVRKQWVEMAGQWPYSGCVVPGHPGWNVFYPGYWDCFGMNMPKRLSDRHGGAYGVDLSGTTRYHARLRGPRVTTRGYMPRSRGC